MIKINEKDFIDEIRYDIKVKDMLKATLVLDYIKEIDEKTQRQALFELSRADDNFSIPLLINILMKNPSLHDTLPMLKETLYAKFLDNPLVFNEILGSEMDKDKRIILIRVAGEIRLETASGVILSIINGEDDERIIKSAVWALGMIGDPKATSSITEYMYSGNAELTITAIQALGQVASPSAIQKLSEKLNADHDLDILILDVFAQVQSPEALEELNNCLSSHFAHQRTTAKQRLVKIGYKAMPNLIKNLLQEDPDLLIHTLNVIGEIGDESAIPSIRKLLHNDPKDPNVRFAAYETLGMLPVKKGALALASGLQDPVDNVRVAAARAIDVNYNIVLAAGLKNILREDGPEKQNIIKVIIDAECDNIFLDLCKEDHLSEDMEQYIRQEAHPELQSHFIELLNENGMSEVATKIRPTETRAETKMLKVFAVDDSKMILSIYRSVLHNLNCKSYLYEFPSEAINKVSIERPDIILTDLNMPDISGIDLTKEIRKLYKKDDLPIIMVTTQNEVKDNEAAFQAGVNKIIQKPFNEEDIGKVLAEFIQNDRRQLLRLR